MNFLEKIASDFKAEAVAALLLEKEQDFDRIIIERLGHLQRTHTKDIHHSYEAHGDTEMEKHTVFQSFRQSLYEALPESVFHPPTLGGLGKSPEEIVEEIRTQRKKEQAARAFFKPFEQEAPYLEIQALLIELMFEKKQHYGELYRLFEQNWPVLKKLTREAAMGFIYMLPLLSRSRGKKEQAEACLTYLTGFPVTIKDTVVPIDVAAQSGGFAVGEYLLGQDSTLPGTHYDGRPAWLVRVGPVEQEAALQVLPGSGFEELLEELLGYFAPAGILVEKRIDIAIRAATSMSFEEPVAARLGYTFTL